MKWAWDFRSIITIHHSYHHRQYKHKQKNTHTHATWSSLFVKNRFVSVVCVCVYCVVFGAWHSHCVSCLLGIKIHFRWMAYLFIYTQPVSVVITCVCLAVFICSSAFFLVLFLCLFVDYTFYLVDFELVSFFLLSFFLLLLLGGFSHPLSIYLYGVGP